MGAVASTAGSVARRSVRRLRSMSSTSGSIEIMHAHAVSNVQTSLLADIKNLKQEIIDLEDTAADLQSRSAASSWVARWEAALSNALHLAYDVAQPTYATYWAKGTGYGTGYSNHLDQELAAYLVQKSNLLAPLCSLLSRVIAAELPFGDGQPKWSRAAQSMARALCKSELLPELARSLLQNDSMSDVQDHAEVYRAALVLIGDFAARQRLCSALFPSSGNIAYSQLVDAALSCAEMIHKFVGSQSLSGEEVSSLGSCDFVLHFHEILRLRLGPERYGVRTQREEDILKFLVKSVKNSMFRDKHSPVAIKRRSHRHREPGSVDSTHRPKKKRAHPEPAAASTADPIAQELAMDVEVAPVVDATAHVSAPAAPETTPTSAGGTVADGIVTDGAEVDGAAAAGAVKPGAVESSPELEKPAAASSAAADVEEVVQPSAAPAVPNASYVDALRPYLMRSAPYSLEFGPERVKMGRVAMEVTTLARSLPLNDGSSVFVVTHAEHPQCMRAMIVGPQGTPYECGLYEFSIRLSSSYPNCPPEVQLLTTGGGSVRFNPNLYNCGKVCLSLLGTWGGSAEEQWNPKQSSILQVLLSIQALILVDQPFYNEPGYESYMGSAAGDTQSTCYNSGILRSSLRYAVLGQLLQAQSSVFAPIIREHFRQRRVRVMELLEKSRHNNPDAIYSALTDAEEESLKSCLNAL